MAEEMINSIKSATENIKEFSSSGDTADGTDALKKLLGDAGNVKSLADKMFI